MRRWIAVLLFVFLPLQLSWAAAAAYCAHEAASAQAAVHLGHHEHQHQAASAADAAVPADLSSAFGDDMDCGVCHGHCVGMLDMADMSPSTMLVAALEPHPLLPFAGISQLPPERPQWGLLA